MMSSFLGSHLKIINSISCVIESAFHLFLFLRKRKKSLVKLLFFSSFTTGFGSTCRNESVCESEVISGSQSKMVYSTKNLISNLDESSFRALLNNLIFMLKIILRYYEISLYNNNSYPQVHRSNSPQLINVK